MDFGYVHELWVLVISENDHRLVKKPGLFLQWLEKQCNSYTELVATPAAHVWLRHTGFPLGSLEVCITPVLLGELKVVQGLGGNGWPCCWHRVDVLSRLMLLEHSWCSPPWGGWWCAPSRASLGELT